MGLFRSRNMLAMDFCCGEVKVIEGRYSRQNLSIKNCITVDIPKDLYHNGRIFEIEQLSYLIGNALKQYDINSKNTTAVINSSCIITREIIMPRVSHKELKSILEYQISDYIPIEVDNYITQYLTTDLYFEGGIEKIKLLLIIIPKDMVETHLRLIKNMGLNPEILDIQANAIAKLIGSNQYINGEYLINGGVIASLDLSYDNIRLNLIKNGKVRISRILETGISNIIDNVCNILNLDKGNLGQYVQKNFRFLEGEVNSENIVTNRVLKKQWIKILEEIEIIFRYYLKKNMNDSIDLILLQGKFFEINYIEEMFLNFFSISTIKLNDLDNMPFQDELASYANAIGSIIRKNEVSL